MTHTVTRQVPAQEIPFEPERVFRFLNTRRDATLAEDLRIRIPELYLEALPCLSPVYRYSLRQVTGVSLPDEYRVQLANGTEFTGVGVHRLLSQSHVAAVFILTVGGDIDSLVRARMPGNPYAGYCLNAIASAMTSGLFRTMQSDLESEISQYEATLLYRYSPGDAHWAIEEQRKLFQLLQPGDLGIRLTDTCYLIPLHSLSGVLGIAGGVPGEAEVRLSGESPVTGGER